MKLALGTVQFGIDYGVSNESGKTPADEVESILKYSNENGIDTIDTAYTYGDSEEVLGTVLSKQKGDFRIVTKTPVFNKKMIVPEDAGTVESAFLTSLRRLRRSKVEGLLVHNADDLLADGGEILFAVIDKLKYKGYVNKIGVSVYTEQQINRLTEKFTFDIIQLPVNVLDQRLIISSCLNKLKKKGIEIWARSVFLQGLLLMDVDAIHEFFNPIKSHLRKYKQYVDSCGLTLEEAAVSFVKNIDEIDYIVIGTNNLQQLKTNLESFNKPHDFPFWEGFKKFALNDHIYINPGLWNMKV